MARRVTTRRRKPTKYRTAREGRSISNDTSIIGVLSFIGVFLFLVLMGIIFIDSDDDRDPYVENVAMSESLNDIDTIPIKKKVTKKEKKSPEKKEQPKEVQDKVVKEEVVIEKEEKPEDKSPRLLPQEVAKENNTEKNIQLSDDEKYRVSYERAKRSGSIRQLHELAKWCDDRDMFGRAEDAHRHVLKLSPNDPKSRKVLGYIQLGGKWTKEEDAHRLGYYKYNDKWVHTDVLKEKGLFLFENEWISRKDAKAKGLVFHEGEAMTRDALKELKKELKEEKKRLAEEKKKRKTAGEVAKKKTYSKQVTLGFRHVKFYTPPVGKWSKTSSGRGAQIVSVDPTVNRNNPQGLIDTLSDADSGIVMTIRGFSPEILYTFADGSAAQGSEIINLMESFRGEAFNLYDDLKFRGVRRSRIGSETFTQQVGIGIKDGKKYSVLLSFFRYETLTYAINIVYPVDENYKESTKKVQYLFENMKKLDRGY